MIIVAWIIESLYTEMMHDLRIFLNVTVYIPQQSGGDSQMLVSMRGVTKKETPDV